MLPKQGWHKIVITQYYLWSLLWCGANTTVGIRATKHATPPRFISVDWKWNHMSVDKISSALFYRLKMIVCHAPSKFYVEELTPNTKTTLIEQSLNTHCTATCYN